MLQGGTARINPRPLAEASGLRTTTNSGIPPAVWRHPALSLQACPGRDQGLGRRAGPEAAQGVELQWWPLAAPSTLQSLLLSLAHAPSGAPHRLQTDRAAL